MTLQYLKKTNSLFRLERAECEREHEFTFWHFAIQLSVVFEFDTMMNHIKSSNNNFIVFNTSYHAISIKNAKSNSWFGTQIRFSNSDCVNIIIRVLKCRILCVGKNCYFTVTENAQLEHWKPQFRDFFVRIVLHHCIIVQMVKKCLLFYDVLSCFVFFFFFCEQWKFYCAWSTKHWS